MYTLLFLCFFLTELDYSKHIALDKLHLSINDIEYYLPDDRRIDIIDHTNKIAYEVDWCEKWEEGIGQSLGYSIATNYKPGLILLYKGDDDDEDYNTALGVVNDLREHGYEYTFIIYNVNNQRYWRY